MGLLSPLPSPSLLIGPLMLTLLAPAASGRPLYQLCPPDGDNYSANSSFETNLRSLLFYLQSRGADTGSRLDSSGGGGPDPVYGGVLCRGDIDANACARCLDIAALDVLEVCPNRKNAIVWYDDCFLRYTQRWSQRAIWSGFADSYMWDSSNVTGSALPLFNEQLGKMMASLALYAVNNSSRSMFATGVAEFTERGPKIYGLVQCVPYLGTQAAEICQRCLNAIIGEIPQRFSGRRGGRTLGTTCYFRYELGRFYNGSAMVSVPSPSRVPGRSSAPSPLPPTSPYDPTAEENKLTSRHISLIIAMGVLLSVITATCICIWKMKASKKTRYNGKIPYTRSLLFELSTLRAATDNFSERNKLGEGGFGAVYKGTLASGQVVAVKRLSTRTKQGLEQLRNEAELLANQEHRNLVTLLGVCFEEEKLLIYEYMPNTSLDKFLFDPTKSMQLTWQQRYKIIEGIARGLLYLHEESRCMVIHRDLKASNILLDANMNPKISDFGISRLFPEDQTHASTSVVAGTFGYMAPEYVFQGKFSNKSDVFSFGVLVFEIVTGRNNRSFSYAEGSVNLLSHIWEHWTIGAIENVIDPSLGGLYQQTELLKCIYAGLLCVQASPDDRPPMSYVVLMLDGLSTDVHAPLQPAFYPGQSRTGCLPKITECSLNELDITDLEPR